MVEMDEEEVLKEMRALLLSAPHGLTSKELHRDFLSFVGSHLPYKQFGYSTLDAYLHSKPHIVRRCVENGQVIYRAVADDTTQHIAKMVAKQKTKKPKSRQVWAQPSPRPHNLSSKGMFGVPYFSPAADSSAKRLSREASRAKVPYETQRRISAVLQSYPSGIFSDNFVQFYRNLNRTDLSPKHLGFNNLREMLQEVPEIARMERTKTGAGFMILPALVKGSSVASPKKSESDHFQAALSASRLKASIGEDLKAEIRQIVVGRPNGLWAGRFPLEFETHFQRPFPFKALGYPSVVELLSAVPDACTIKRPFSTGDFLVFPVEGQTKAPATAGEKSSASSISLDRHHTSSPASRYNEQPLLNHSGHSHQFAAKQERDFPSSMQKTKALSLSERLIDDKTRHRLVDLVRSCMPRGLKLSSALSAFQQKYREPLELHQLGFHNVESLFSIMQSCLLVEQIGADFVVKTKESANALVPSTATASEPSNSNIMDSSPIASSPSARHDNAAASNHWQFGESGSWARSHHHHQPRNFASLCPPPQGSLYRVVLTDAVSPGNFSLQFVSDETTGRLESLSHLINSVYEGRQGTNFILKSPDIGCQCAALFEDGSWYRATVQHQLPGNQFQVLYVDYGNTGSVASSCLRTLRDDMVSLPAQAVQCSLHGVPADSGHGEWSADCMQKFLSVAGTYQQFSARVHSYKDGMAEVSLFSNAGQSVNEQLCAAMGRSFSPVCVSPTSDLSDRNLRLSPANSSVQSSNHRPTSQQSSHSVHRSSTPITSVRSPVAPFPLAAAATAATASGGDSGTEGDCDSDDTLPDLEAADSFGEEDDLPPLESVDDFDDLTSSQWAVSSSLTSGSGSGSAEIPLELIDDSFPPPLEPMDGSNSDDDIVGAPTSYTTDTESIAPDSALEDSVDVLDEKIENMTTLVESLELARNELFLADGHDSSAARDSFDRVLRMTQYRVEHLKRIAAERRSVQNGQYSIPVSHRPAARHRSFGSH